LTLTWRISEGVIVVSLPCAHEAIVRPGWIGAGGSFVGRLGCNEAGCRRVHEDVVLEGWRA
jgi:hypothetical protein